MKKRIIAAVLLMLMLTLSACGSFKVYDLNDILPPLIDVTTQYPYTEKITVTNCATGETLEFTEGADHDLIRMRLEGIRCIREKDKEEDPTLFEVTFHTTEGTTTIEILSQYDYVIDGYHYEAMRSSVDLYYFESLFTE